MRLLSTEQINFYKENGYLLLKRFVNKNDINEYIHNLEKLHDGTIDPGNQKNDLGRHVGISSTGKENITQIMFPSDFIPSLYTSSFFRKSKIVAKELLGDDMERDMDMVVEKFPFTNVATPWHQDSAYWPKGMKDNRSLSCWLALDDATLDNGCMWYVPGSHMEATRKHNWAGNDEKKSYALVTECDESEGVACPIPAGDMIVHDGRTLHYTRGNNTAGRRRALITNYRSKEMIKWERSIGYNHRNEKINDNNVIT